METYKDYAYNYEGIIDSNGNLKFKEIIKMKPYQLFSTRDLKTLKDTTVRLWGRESVMKARQLKDKPEAWLDYLNEKGYIYGYMRNNFFAVIGKHIETSITEMKQGFNDSPFVNCERAKSYSSDYGYFADILNRSLTMNYGSFKQNVYRSNNTTVRTFVFAMVKGMIDKLSEDKKKALFLHKKEEPYETITSVFTKQEIANISFKMGDMGCILPQKVVTNPYDTSSLKWTVEQMTPAVHSAEKKYRTELAHRVTNYIIDRTNYEHMAHLYKKLAERKRSRLEHVNDITKKYEAHVARKKEHSLVQTVLNGNYPEGTRLKMLQNLIINTRNYTKTNDEIKNDLKRITKLSFDEVVSKGTEYTAKLDKRTTYFMNKLDKFREKMMISIDWNIGAMDFDDFVSHKNLNFHDITHKQWLALEKEYKKYLAHQSLRARLRMNIDIKSPRPSYQIEEGKRKWADKLTMMNIQSALETIPVSGMTISPKGKRLYI